MKKLIFFIFVAIMTLLPSLSFADMITPESRCKFICKEFCLDCASNTFISDTGDKRLNELCNECDSCLSPDESKNFCIEISREWCVKYCYNCKSHTFKPDAVCEKCHDIKYHEMFLGDFCKDHTCDTLCDDRCIDCETQSFKDGPECKDCRSYCDTHTVKKICQEVSCREVCTDCFDCKTNDFKKIPECKKCRFDWASKYNNEDFKVFCMWQKSIDWCSKNCFDCKTNAKTPMNSFCPACDYTIEELQNACNKIEETTQKDLRADNKIQVNAEPPQGTVKQPEDSTEHSIHKPKFSCSASPYAPTFNPIALLLVLLLSLGLFIHIRRSDK